MTDLPMTFYWEGRPADELSREELYEIILKLEADKREAIADKVRRSIDNMNVAFEAVKTWRGQARLSEI